MKRPYRCWLLVTLAILCSSSGVGHANQPPTPSEPEWLLLRIDAVRVTGTRPNGGSWDGEKEKQDSGAGCALVSLVAGAATRGTGTQAANSVCRFFFTEGGSPQIQKEPKAPDLVVKLVADSKTIYRTYIAQDTYSHMFLYSVVLPVAAIPRSGLQVVVEDQDGNDVLDGELIGSVRIGREQLVTTARGTSPILALQDGPLEKLELIIEPYTDTVRTATHTYSVAMPLTEVPQLQISAGEVIEIRANGNYSVADNGQLLGPAGYQDGSRRGYNLPDLWFRSMAHGAAIARIGDRGAHATFAIPDCVLLTSPFAGSLSVGINDKDLSNNKGELLFSAVIRPPRPEEWSRAGLLLECSGPSDSEANLPQTATTQAAASQQPATPPPVSQPSAVPPPASQQVTAPHHSAQADMTLESPQVRESMQACGIASQFHGTSELHIAIDAAGQGTLTRAIAEGASLEFIDCLSGIVRQLHFNPTRGRRVRYFLNVQ